MSLHLTLGAQSYNQKRPNPTKIGFWQENEAYSLEKEKVEKSGIRLKEVAISAQHDYTMHFDSTLRSTFTGEQHKPRDVFPAQKIEDDDLMRLAMDRIQAEDKRMEEQHHHRIEASHPTISFSHSIHGKAKTKSNVPILSFIKDSVEKDKEEVISTPPHSQTISKKSAQDLETVGSISFWAEAAQKEGRTTKGYKGQLDAQDLETVGSISFWAEAAQKEGRTTKGYKGQLDGFAMDPAASRRNCDFTKPVGAYDKDAEKVE
ncbi:hypothetical protein ADUPG1_008182 [Aduncisulcus paluster]|uniref:Uncharacterized protein n=1 Tax=Aduncisulcus paluster TaxID=2918883 RepID=A0ABQ5KU42_9EUKA|nr:hypothetical protein ADUPG1_008182 [Aduncisulcus paluster]